MRKGLAGSELHEERAVGRKCRGRALAVRQHAQREQALGRGWHAREALHAGIQLVSLLPSLRRWWQAPVDVLEQDAWVSQRVGARTIQATENALETLRRAVSGMEAHLLTGALAQDVVAQCPRVRAQHPCTLAESAVH